MDYKEKYEQALERAKKLQADAKGLILNRWLYGVFPELKESEDERMVKFIKNQLFNIKKTITENYELDAKLTNAIDWLEKQGEHANFRNKIQIGDKVTRNEDGELVNLSQFKRIVKKGKQKPTWSEEDERMLGKVISTIRYALSIPLDSEDDSCFAGSSTISWLKSLKERMKG